MDRSLRKDWQRAATADQTAHTLRLLASMTEPITAAELADRLGLAGSRESRRRTVRKIVNRLRVSGNWIVATLTGGYWLTAEDSIWRDYNEGRQISAVRILAEGGRRRRAVRDRGQRMLFEPACVGEGAPC